VLTVDLSDALWRKSTYSNGSGGDCVEITGTGRVIAVRDSKDPDGPVLAIIPSQWRAFLTDVRSGQAGRLT
jgi:hypothetical protein